MANDTIVPLGNLNMDDDNARVANGDYSYALDIDYIDDEGKATVSAQNSLGNSLSFQLGSVVPQVKVFTSFMGTQTTPLGKTAQVFRSNGLLWFEFNYFELSTQAATIADFVNEFQSAFAAFLNAPPFIVQTSFNFGQFKYNLNQVGLDWNIVIDGEPQEIVQECVGQAGTFKPLASKAIDKDLFVWSAITNDEPIQVNITNSVQQGLMVRVNVAAYANPVIGLQHVFVSNTGTGMDGAWLAQNTALQPFQFTLIGSRWTVNGTGGTIKIGTEAIGEIGIAQYNEGLNTYTYTRLIRSRQFNWVMKHQIDARPTERNIRSTNFYFTDNYNRQFCLYYKGAYSQDGFIRYVNPANGLYAYQGLENEIKSQVISAAKIEFTGQTIGGALKSGGYRYVIRTSSGGNNLTEISLPTGLINVYSQPNSNLAVGNEVGEATNKINQFKITNIPQGIFENIELIAILYSSSVGAISATMVRSYKLSQTQTSIDVQHSGDETGSFDLPQSDLFILSQIYKTVKSNQIIDNRMVNSNVTYYEDVDFREFFKTWEHSIVRDAIDDSGNFYGKNDAGFNIQNSGSPYPSKANLKYGEYQVPLNVNKSMSLMVNETYRFMAVCRMKESGLLSPAYWIDDICINDRAANENALGAAITYKPSTTTTRRVGTVPDVAIVSGQNTNFSLGPAIPFGAGQPIIGISSTGIATVSAPHGLSSGSVVVIQFAPTNSASTANGVTGANTIQWTISVGAYSTQFTLLGWVNTGLDIVSDVNMVYRTVTGAGNWGDFKVLTYGVEFSGFNLGYIVNGKPFYELVDEIFIFRVDCVPEILFTGVLIPSMFGYIDSAANHYEFGVEGGNGVGITDMFDTQGSHPTYTGVQTTARARALPPYSILPQFNPTTDQYATYPNQAAFYSPDHDMSGNNLDQYLSSDYILNYGVMFYTRSTNGLGFQASGGKTPFLLNSALELTSLDKPKSIDMNPMQNFTDAGFVDQGGVFNNNGFPNYSKSQRFEVANPHPNEGKTIFELAASWYFDLNQNLFNGTIAQPDLIADTICYGQYYRARSYNPNDPESNKYGTFESTTSYYTGFSLNVKNNVAYAGKPYPTGLFSVYGGDVFNQKYFHKIRIPSTSTQTGFSANTSWIGGGGALIYYSQNRNNARMCGITNSSGGRQFPVSTYSEWLSPEQSQAPKYDPTYNFWTKLKAIAGYSTLVKDSIAPTRTVYSSAKPQDGTYDGYRDFQPLNFLDVPLTDGAIIHHEVISGELFIIQERNWLKYFFNTRGQLQTAANTTAIVVGDGSVLERPPIQISAFGTRNKWGFIKGKTPAGQDVVYWIDMTLKAIVRFGADGTRNISLENKIDTFIRNNTSFLDGVDTPAWKYGVSSVWNEKKKSAIWSARGINSALPIWFSNGSYTQGIPSLGVKPSIVWFGDTDNTAEWEQLPSFYECILTNSGTALNKPNSGADWQTYWKKLPITDNRVYNVWTLEFSEVKNGFSTFRPFHSKIFMPFRNTYLTGDPRVNGVDEARIYTHNSGKIGVWYNGYGTGQEINAYIKMLWAKGGDLIKHYLAIDLNANIDTAATPTLKRFKLFTKRNETFMENQDLELREDMYFVEVKNDINDPSFLGQNDEDTDEIRGQYVEILFTFATKVKEYLTQLTIKFNISSRNPNT